LVADICASFQQSVVDVLIAKTLFAANKFGIKNVLLGVGVSANSELRKQFTVIVKKEKKNLMYPSKKLCTDNAAMIAAAAYYKLKYNARKDIFFSPFDEFKVVDDLPITNWY
jgi:N6-L-threonylcarbamoyladenine synthase